MIRMSKSQFSGACKHQSESTQMDMTATSVGAPGALCKRLYIKRCTRRDSCCPCWLVRLDLSKPMCVALIIACLEQGSAR